MFNPMRVFEQLTEVMDEKASRVVASALGQVYEELSNTATRQDFADLKGSVNGLEAAIQRLAEAQGRTEERLGTLEAAMQRLADAQGRTEERLGTLEAAMQRLAEAQGRTEERLGTLEAAMQRLAEAQSRADERMEQLAEAQANIGERLANLAEAQARTDERLAKLTEAHARTDEHVDFLGSAIRSLEDRFDHFELTFKMQIGALGARWGMQSEESFRGALREILSYAGYMVERFEARDDSGAVHGKPSHVEIDVVMYNGRTLLAELKASASAADVREFGRKGVFYASVTGRSADRLIVVSPHIGPRALEVATELGMVVCTSVEDIDALPQRI
jgi:hypothetical protein